MAQAEFSGAIAGVAVLLMAGSALAANECAGLPHSSPHPRNALSDFFVGAGPNAGFYSRLQHLRRCHHFVCGC